MVWLISIALDRSYFVTESCDVLSNSRFKSTYRLLRSHLLNLVCVDSTSLLTISSQVRRLIEERCIYNHCRREIYYLQNGTADINRIKYNLFQLRCNFIIFLNFFTLKHYIQALIWSKTFRPTNQYTLLWVKGFQTQF